MAVISRFFVVLVMGAVGVVVCGSVRMHVSMVTVGVPETVVMIRRVRTETHLRVVVIVAGAGLIGRAIM